MTQPSLREIVGHASRIRPRSSDDAEAIAEEAITAIKDFLVGIVPEEGYRNENPHSGQYDYGWNACRQAILEAIEKL